MTMRMRAAVLGPLLALFAGCPQNTTPPDPINIDIAVDKTEVVANGTNTVAVSISHTSDVKLVASRGRFKDQKGGSVTVTGGSGTVELITCDSREEETCAGTVRISATSTAGDATGSTRITFTALENCGNGEDDNGDNVVDCADPTCVGYTCALPAGSVGEGSCQANGTCLCNGNGGAPEPNESSCADNKDNDCDGLVDCKDANCETKTCILASGGQGVCVSGECGCPGTAEEDPESCSDQIDNDCDGRVDCDDRGCQAKLGEPGITCDEFGRTCSRGSLDGGFGTCSVCPGGENAEVTCGDQKDNDCDGLSDCDDPQCASGVCGENGRTCNVATARCECSGNGGLVETLERTCGDGADNDCDGKVDCGDEDCQPAGSVVGRACGPNGLLCGGDGKCACSGNGGDTQDKEVTCFDGADNDCDGLVDCAEAACQPVGNGVGQICNTAGHLVTGIGELTCSSPVTGVSACNVCSVPGGMAETAEGVSTASGATPSCGDGLDNDCDGPMDCGDPNCTGLPCDLTGKKCGANGQCTCTPSPSGPEQVCTDGMDNDCDGKVDCADTTCDNRACVLANGAPGRCKAGACGCPGIPEDSDLACSDGIDDDCDGLIDCEDSDCQASLAAAGKGCDANGKQCGKPDLAGLATCSVCSRNEPNGETRCSDGEDNDCDGLKDCADPDCAGRTCGNHGVFCNGSTQACECTGNGANPEFAEVSCADGIDNDCDGNKDCRDTECQPSAAGPGAACAPFGFLCDQTGACNCAGNGGAAEPGDAGESICNDGIDNDCDGIKDCQETYCQAVGNQPGKVCDSLGHAASGVGEITCSAGTVAGGATCSICTLPDGKLSEYGGQEGQSTVSNGAPTCGDGVDNDCNGPIDCADPACTGQPCNSTGSKCTSSGTCACTKTETSEVSCLDGVDNDCDGKVDCDDINCAGLTCVISGTTVRGVCLGTQGCGCPGEPEDGGTTCSDGRDNDCDGRSDCEDPECQTVQVISPTGQYIAVPGQECDSVRGLRCGRGNPDAGGVATCSLCIVNTPLADGGVSDETSCFDTVDNDCDGLVDCADTTCQPASGTGPGRACRPDGGWACGGGGTCDCFQADGSPGEAAESTCDDGLDNDCDTLADCADPDCRPSLTRLRGGTCAANGKACDTNGLCSCSPADGGFEAAEVTCSDGVDNDCDGLSDCAETACQPVGNNPGAICDRLGHAATAPIGELTCSSTLSGPSTCSVCTVPNDSLGNAGRVEVSEGITPGPPNTAAITCGDGLDNDCDGRFDCNDSNCVGKVCDATGKVCGTDGRCVCAGGVSVESSCSDGLDDDCDGKVDCVDPDCQPAGNNPGKSCGSLGQECTTTGICACAGNGGTAQPTEAACGDGFDNDCDGFTDCADTNCRSSDFTTPDGGSCDDPNASPAMVGFKCDSLGGCACPGGEQTETTCLDGKDNDCDGKSDCADPDCQPPAGGGLGKACNTKGMRCTAPAPGASAGTCTDCRPPALDGGAGELTEVTCYDSVDNDCDGVSDCSDTNCQPQPPNTTGASCKGPGSSQVCVLGGAGGSSGTGSGAGPTTTQGICLDPAIGGNITLTATQANIPSDGTFSGSGVSGTLGTVATTTIVATAKYGPDVSQPTSLIPLSTVTCSRTDSGGNTLTEQGIVFTISAGSGTLVDPADATRTSTTSLCMPTDSSGVARVTLRANSTATDTSVTASYDDDIGLYSGKKLAMTSDPIKITEAKLGTVVVAPSPNYEKLMGVKGSGYRESQNVSFILRDANTNLYPAGLTVYFTHESKGGSYLGDVPQCLAGTPRICWAIGTTDATGKATVTINSGTLATNAYVKASAVAGGSSASVSATDLVFVGAKASGSNISLSCEFRTDPKDSTSVVGIPPLMEGALTFPDYFDCSKTIYRVPANGKLKDFGYTCVGFFGDRYNNVIAIPTVTTLASEAGNAAPPGPNAPAASATAPSVDGWIVSGQSINVVAVTGYNTPVDVPTDLTLHPNEPSASNLDDGINGSPGCGTRTRNPRDELGTTILTVAGEEGFVDGSNGCPADGTYNPAGTTGCLNGRGENFIDIGEPFVDLNDNNVRDTGEYYVDTNSDGSWNGPNGRWDADTTLWLAKRVRYTSVVAYTGTTGGGRPKLYAKSDGTSPVASPTAYNYVLMSSDADTTGAVDSPALTSNNQLNGSFYAALFDINSAPLTAAATFTPSDKNPLGGPKPTMVFTAPTVELATTPDPGFTEAQVFCPNNPASSTINLANCTSSCGGVSGTAVDAATGACYPATKIALFPKGREVSASFSANGSGVTFLGMGATTQLLVGQNLDGSARYQRYTGTTENAAQTLSVCVRQTPGALCQAQNACNPSGGSNTITVTDACGLSRTIKCGGCASGSGCCGFTCKDLQTDNNNCGSCGNACVAPQTCNAGTCS